MVDALNDPTLAEVCKSTCHTDLLSTTGKSRRSSPADGVSAMHISLKLSPSKEVTVKLTVATPFCMYFLSFLVFLEKIFFSLVSEKSPTCQDAYSY